MVRVSFSLTGLGLILIFVACSSPAGKEQASFPDGFVSDLDSLFGDAVPDAKGPDVLLDQKVQPDTDVRDTIPDGQGDLGQDQRDTVPELTVDVDAQTDLVTDLVEGDGCKPQCEEMECGPDGCGGDCGPCDSGYFCQELGGAKVCLADCLSLCSGKECGTAGKNGECACGGVCDDLNLCTTNACNEGSCVFTPMNGAECDDANPCTSPDLCSGLSCVGTPPGPESPLLSQCTCSADAECTIFDDSNLCNGVLYCKKETGQTKGYCAIKPGTVKTCNDNNPCTQDDCVPATGNCRFADDDTLSCSDKDPCNGAESCKAGACVRTAPPTCDDGNPCTTDECVVNEGCGHGTLPNYTGCGALPVFQCIGGVCKCVPACTGKDCGDDGCGSTCGTCAANQECKSGLCKCVPNCTGRNCGTDGCGGDCGKCPAGINCVNGNCACTADCKDKTCGTDGCGGSCGACSGEFTCVDGSCVCFPEVYCNDPGVKCGYAGCGMNCGSCAADELCYQHKCFPKNTFCTKKEDCNDSNPCTLDDCVNNSCQFACSAGTICNDGVPGTSGDVCKTVGDTCVCKGVGECEFEWQCDDGNDCTEDRCIGAVCSHPCFGGKACDDGVALTIEDKCGTTPEGKCACAGRKVDCLSGDCDDGDLCTINDTCIGYSCKGTQKNCADTNPCTADTCEAGVCKNVFDPVVLCPSRGCMDGSREGYAEGTYQTIAACKGMWSNKDLRAARSAVADPGCGQSVTNVCPVAEDLCAPGWHVCMKSGNRTDLSLRLTQPNGSECRTSTIVGSFIAAASHSQNTANCVTNAAELYPCSVSGTLSAPICCGSTCVMGTCTSAVWSGNTPIYSGAGVACATINWQTLNPPTGVLCCKDQ